MSTLSVSSLHITLSTAGKIIHTRAERRLFFKMGTENTRLVLKKFQFKGKVKSN